MRGGGDLAGFLARNGAAGVRLEPFAAAGPAESGRARLESHRALWQGAAAGRSPTLVLEPDALLRRDVRARLDGILAALGADWDVLVLGYRPIRSLEMRLVEGLDLRVVPMPIRPARADVGAYLAAGGPASPVRLTAFAGAFAYLVAPRAAGGLLRRLPEPAAAPSDPSYLDVGFGEACAGLRTFAAMPPLAFCGRDLV
jgi:GR25 family glycosyltransferase involved in LPS biosynthesis